MSKLNWKVLSERSCRANGKYGEWQVGMQGDHWYVKLTHKSKSTLSSREERFQEDWERVREFELHGDEKYNLKEFYIARSYVSSVELLTVESLDEAIAVVDLIESLPDTIPNWETTISEAGFTVKENKFASDYLSYENTEWRLSLTIHNSYSNTGMWFRYEPNGPRWHNLATMWYAHLSHNKIRVVYDIWPTDLPPLDIMALIVAEIKRIRTAGGKRKTRYPPKELTIKTLCSS